VAKLRDLKYRFFRAILFGRFEPIETAMAFSATIHGAIIGWLLSGGDGFLSLGPTLTKYVVSLVLVISGILVVIAINYNIHLIREYANMAEFVSWLALLGMVFMSPTADVILYVGYATLAVVSSLVYLNVAVGDET
jgi:hypothetical protein